MKKELTLTKMIINHYEKLLSQEKIYRNERCQEVLKTGTIKGIDYAIVTYGTHPCCYVRVNKNSKLYEIDYQDVDDMISYNPNGGFTFSDKNFFPFDKDKNKWVLGWDYAHSGDYHPYWNEQGKKQTEKSLMTEVKKVINAIVEIDN